MRSLGPIFRKLIALLSRRQLESDLDAELAFHLEMRHEEEIRRGKHSKEAALASRRQFGSTLRVKEQSREAWLFAWLESVLQDVRFAARGLRRSPAFALVAITVLAVGIGGTVAIFSVVNAILLRPLPFKDSDRVVYVQGNRGSLRPGVMALLVRTADLPRLRQASQTLSSFSILLPRAVKIDGFGGGWRGSKPASSLDLLRGVRPVRPTSIHGTWPGSSR